jgi:hypothetical protein
VSDRQAVAFSFPCAAAQETLDQKFWERMCVDGRWLSTIVTINK